MMKYRKTILYPVYLSDLGVNILFGQKMISSECRLTWQTDDNID